MSPSDKEKFDEICRIVCFYHGVEIENIHKNARNHEKNIIPRGIVFMVTKAIMPHITDLEMGKLVANRNHSSVCAARKSMRNLIETDHNFSNKYFRILTECMKATASNHIQLSIVKSMLTQCFAKMKHYSEIQSKITETLNLIENEQAKANGSTASQDGL